ncbi:hypothetical protein PoB_003027000 [Plakobranchus ocellatus]|uniref:Uncharacterized protein n=1 Tax=Plakobranchus ocellatus TaxID=259542 RepID=A0AAV4AAD8_9GAST|nr:hypothetical protein PoB_003027000 [Plakobranchus ocellatus]
MRSEPLARGLVWFFNIGSNPPQNCRCRSQDGFAIDCATDAPPLTRDESSLLEMRCSADTREQRKIVQSWTRIGISDLSHGRQLPDQISHRSSEIYGHLLGRGAEKSRGRGTDKPREESRKTLMNHSSSALGIGQVAIINTDDILRVEL